MKTAFYHQRGRKPIQLEVIKDHGTTVDLGKGKKVLVSDCPWSDEAAPGVATKSLPKKAGKSEKGNKKADPKPPKNVPPPEEDDDDDDSDQSDQTSDDEVRDEDPDPEVKQPSSPAGSAKSVIAGMTAK